MTADASIGGGRRSEGTDADAGVGIGEDRG